MNLRKRLTIIILSAFILNSIIILGYYELSLSRKLATTISTMQSGLDNKVEYISSLIESSENNNIKDILEDDTIDKINRNEIFIYIENSKGDVIYERGRKNYKSLNITSVDMISKKGNSYMVKLVKPLKVEGLIGVPIVKDILKVEIVVIGVILLLLTTIIYVKIVQPILSLQTDIYNYTLGIKPVRTNRRDEIGWLKNNFVELTKKLEYEKEIQNRIIASISHDIKTPLTSIMGYTERLKTKDIEKERQKKYIDIIYSKSQNIKELIDEFDDYLSYNLENSIKKEKISIRNLSLIVKEEYEDEITQLGIEFSIKSNCDEATINIDKSKIRRVFGNIISNSIKHMDKKDKKIEIIFKDIGHHILVSISDNGNGVNDNELDKIFKALYTSDKSRKVAGLGLSICKSAIEGHSGDIWAENNEFGGLTINFTLPKENIN